jgi:hypothetical protein
MWPNLVVVPPPALDQDLRIDIRGVTVAASLKKSVLSGHACIGGRWPGSERCGFVEAQ